MKDSLLFTPEIDRRARELLAQMTVFEKLGQLSQYTGDLITGPEATQIDKLEMAARGGIGSLMSILSAKSSNLLQRQAVEKSRLKIPILFGMDVIHGLRTVYPVPLGLAASWNPGIIEECAKMAARESRAVGIRWTFSPMVDIGRDSRWGRVTEGAGEDTYLGCIVAAAWVRGYQGTDLSDNSTILACAKHYVAYGAAEGGRDYESVDISERVLRDVYLPPFKAAVDAGVGTLMSSFNTLQGIPASANKWTLTDILRGEWGFTGFVVSDWGSIVEMMAHGIANEKADAAFKSLTAGVDMDMENHLYLTQGEDLLDSGRLSIASVDEAVLRVLRIKFALGLFENPYADENRSSELGTPEHRDIARRAAEESFVLLKNEPVDGTPLLPLAVGKRVALIGALASSSDDMLGAWADGDEPITLYQSLSEKLGSELVYVRGVDVTGDSDPEFEDAIAAASEAEIVIMALGELRHMSGEAKSRSEIILPGRQLELLKAVVAAGRPVVLVLFNGRPLALPWEAANVPAILEAWFPGVEAGPAVVRALYGDINPSGRLNVSFPHSNGQMPLYYNKLNTGRPALKAQPGQGMITGYIDQFNTALFPFGYGLSYTNFNYSQTVIVDRNPKASELNSGDSITVRGSVANIGEREGAEVVQLYIRQRGTSVARPIRELKGFTKITLSPGERRDIQFTLTREELSFWNIGMDFTVEPCELTVWIAPNSVAGEPDTVIISA